MPWNGGDTELREFFKKAIAMRQKLAALRRGDFRMVSAEAGSGLIVFARKLGGQKATVCINRGNERARIPELDGSVYWADGLDGKTLRGGGFGVFSSCEA